MDATDVNPVEGMKYVVVSGGVLSGLGKGVTASSIGVLLKSAGLQVTSIKIDPYLNSDAGTMSPFEHGEVFVLDDGGEVDLDLGNYERFLDINLQSENNLTTGKIYAKVIEAERRGDYLGKTVQVIPHITDAVQDWIEDVSKKSDGDKPPDACVIELGGTVGDIESAPFIEALRQFQFRVGRENICFVHVSLVPVMGPVGEQKTKPTQHTVKELMGLGITPDVLVCRSSKPLNEETREKLSAFCHVRPEAVFSTHDVPNIYHVPLMLEEQGFCNILDIDCDKTGLLDEWRAMAHRLDELTEEVNIAMVGKYTDLSDAYLSVIKSLQHAALAVERKLNIDWIEASDLEDSNNNEAWDLLRHANGILVPGGFGDRGIEGKILAAQYARENNLPYFGLCLGMQIAVIDFARNVLGLEKANSEEFDSDTPDPVIHIMDDQKSIEDKGATMRLGACPCALKKGTSAYTAYEKEEVSERHRHRFEFNNAYREKMEDAGLVIAGTNPERNLVEIVEVENHPWYVGVQFHPEFQSKPNKAHPLFASFIEASLTHRLANVKQGKDTSK